MSTVTSTHQPVISPGLAELMRRGLELANAKSQKPENFEDQLQQLIEGANAPNAGYRLKVEEKPVQGNGGPSGIRHFVVTMIPVDPSAPAGLDSGPAKPGAAAEPELERLPTIPADTANKKYTDFDNPLPAVERELKAMGVDSSSLKMHLWDEETMNIAGHYTNHYIRVNFPNGQMEDYSIEYTLRNPKITAVDIQRVMGLGAPTVPRVT